MIIYFFRIIFLILLLQTLGCVSVSVPISKETSKAEHIKFKAPPAFNTMNADWADHAWQNSTTRNTISFLSECGSDPRIEALLGDALATLDTVEKKEDSELIYNQRRALRTLGYGTVDGVSVFIDVLVLKKDKCNFTIVHSGRKERRAETQKHFDEFLQNFVVP
ncbi:MAG: hypothetical protein ACLGGX_10425 [Bdellovibrionia bacterium]